MAGIWDDVLGYGAAAGMTAGGAAMTAYGVPGGTALMGAGIGMGVKRASSKAKQSQADAQRKVEAEKTRLSPYTGSAIGDTSRIQDPNMFSDMLSGGLQGAYIGNMIGGGAAKGAGAASKGVEGATTTEAALAKEAAAGSSGIAGDRTSSEGLKYFFGNETAPVNPAANISKTQSAGNIFDILDNETKNDIRINKSPKELSNINLFNQRILQNRR